MWWINAVVSFIVGIFKAWFGEKERTQETEKAGSNAQALETEKEANAKIAEAQKARDDTKPITADDLPNHIPGNDPNFRD
jgi:hypothetical protein